MNLCLCKKHKHQYVVLQSHVLEVELLIAELMDEYVQYCRTIFNCEYLVSVTCEFLHSQLKYRRFATPYNSKK